MLLCLAAGGSPATEAQPQVRLGDKTFVVTVADTNETRRQGLSDSAPLAADRGMLFIFERDGRHGIWMKDMRFALDIIWISRFGAVVHIERSVHPDTYPRAFTPDKPAKYVLEISAGAGEGVSVGAPVYFENVFVR